MRKKKDRRVLVLNIDFTPIGIGSWEEAQTNTFKNMKNYHQGVETIDFYKDDFIKDTAGRKHPCPAVVRTRQYVKPKKSVPFSRKNVFIRDKLTCQYCGKVDECNNLTYDHVIPRVKWDKKNGSPTRWDNIVTACKPCNNRKGDKLLKDCGMKLFRLPTKPSPHLYIAGLSPWSEVPDEWLPYLPDVYKMF